MKHPELEIKANLEKDEQDLQRCKKHIRQLFYFRLCSFIAIFPALLWLPTGYNYPVAFVILAVFLRAVQKNIQLEKQKDYINRLLKIERDELKAIAEDYSHLESGEEFINPEHPYSFDLDLFTKGGLFQFLNRTTTLGGKTKLASLLKTQLTSVDELKDRQHAVNDLAEKLRWRNEFSAKIFHPKANEATLLKNLSKQTSLRNKTRVQWLLKIVAHVSVIALILCITGTTSWTLLLLIAVVNTAILSVSKKTIDTFYENFGKQASILASYADVFKMIETEKFNSTNLQQLQQQLTAKDINASQAIKKLEKTIGLFDYRANLFFIFIADPLFLWDLFCVNKLDNWQRDYQQHISQWFAVAEEFDALSSLANLAHTHPEFSFPELTDKPFTFAGKNFNHPLLKKATRVGNNFDMLDSGQIAILTGANMAGKSTFLRTIGINLVLATMGCPCCCDSLKISPIRLYTNMRTSDNLLKAESYFHAELLRLQQILAQIRSGIPTFVLIDEMLKGTNSVDKLEGSKELTRLLTQLKTNGIIATHDLALTDLKDEFPTKIKTICFDIEIENDTMIFDYKLKSGITKTLNAGFLMRKMGITS